MIVTLLYSCVNCVETVALREAALAQGHDIVLEKVVRSDYRTLESAKLNIGLPVLCDENGLYSGDGVNWVGNRIKKTNPVTEVVGDVDDY